MNLPASADKVTSYGALENDHVVKSAEMQSTAFSAQQLITPEMEANAQKAIFDSYGNQVNVGDDQGRQPSHVRSAATNNGGNGG
ncbi:hypothetical protein FHS19_001729 [Paenibacillus rhizosphaerae]|uniref:Uncharacterized protein n=1 Tax=Paenibacillus rhizosphaerae TaxID=297318 RepID=A0A839TJU6_9BACL|nr:hypothetical protein [Paenibacillus rhizosphaerae]MBB3127075.1 hypothetical protein [Paenibacillus rhizosphaerae]